MINNDKIQNTRIKRLKVIFPILALIVIFIIFIQSIKIEINDEDKNLTLILSDKSNEGVLKPSMIGETSSGQPFVLNALKATMLL